MPEIETGTVQISVLKEGMLRNQNLRSGYRKTKFLGTSDLPGLTGLSATSWPLKTDESCFGV